MVRWVFVARDHNGMMLGMVAAPNEAAAHTYWFGAGVIPHTVGLIDVTMDTGMEVLPLVKTKEVALRSLRDRFKPWDKIRVIE